MYLVESTVRQEKKLSQKAYAKCINQIHFEKVSNVFAQNKISSTIQSIQTLFLFSGIIFYMFSLRWMRRPKKHTITSATNGGFMSDIEATAQIDTSIGDQLPDQESTKIRVESSRNHEKITISNENHQKQTSDCHEHIDGMPSNHSEPLAIDTSAASHLNEMKVIPKTSSPQFERKPPQKGCYLDHSKLDEIASVDDVRHTIIECREPNGTTYFVEADTITVAESSNGTNDDTITTATTTIITNQSNQLCELSEMEKIELERNIVERVLNQTDIQLASNQASAVVCAGAVTDDDFISDDSSVEEEREVRAIVHATNSRFNSPMYTPPPTPITSPAPPPSQPCHKVHLFEKRAQTVRAPNFRIETYEAMPAHKLLYENDQSRRAFKLRLENLFKQNDESRAPKAHFASPVARYSHRILPYNHSISAPESLAISLNGNDDGDDEMVSAKIEIVSVPLSLPPLTPSAVLTTEKASIDSPSTVPSAPVFNQQLYDTIGRRKRMAAGDVIDIDDDDNTAKSPPSKSVPQTLQKSNLQRTKAHENLAHLHDSDDGDDSNHKNQEIPNITGIRKQLENIFSKGRTVQADVVDLDMNQNENLRRSKRHELIDTVRMQKMRFSSVLKSIESIGPDIHANLHPTNTLAANDIQCEIKRRESMNETHLKPMMNTSEPHRLNGIGDETTTTITIQSNEIHI